MRRSDEDCVNGTEDDTHNNSCSALFGAFSNTASLCANTKMTLSSIRSHISPLTHTQTHSRHTVHKAMSVLSPLLDKEAVPIAMAVCISVFSNVAPHDEQTLH